MGVFEFEKLMAVFSRVAGTAGELVGRRKALEGEVY